MNADIITEVKNLVMEDARPSIILRQILAHEDHRQMSRLWLTKELRDLFDMDLKTAIRTGGWSYWDGEGFDDAELDELLEGKLTLKQQHGEEG